MAPDSPSFTEEQWLASADPADMISVIFPKSTERQMSLFMTACCRRVWKWMPPVCREAVDLLERAAEISGPCDKTRATLRKAALPLAEPQITIPISECYAVRAAVLLTDLHPQLELHAKTIACLSTAVVAADGLVWSNDPTFDQILEEVGIELPPKIGIWELDRQPAASEQDFLPEELSQFPGWATERKAQAEQLRHIVGNPFRPYPAPAFWPATVVEVAQAVYNGAGDQRILSDALEDAGHRELAEHFRQENWHPKGCWALDLILAKRSPR